MFPRARLCKPSSPRPLEDVSSNPRQHTATIPIQSFQAVSSLVLLEQHLFTNLALVVVMLADVDESPVYGTPLTRRVPFAGTEDSHAPL